MAFLPAIATAMGASASTVATLGTVGSVASAVGTGLAVVGAIQGGKAEASAAQFNADAARREAASREAAQRTAAQRQLGSIRAGVSKSGATMEAPAHGAVGVCGQRRDRRTEHAILGSREAALYESRGRNARTAGYLRAGTSLLTGASQPIPCRRHDATTQLVRTGNPVSGPRAPRVQNSVQPRRGRWGDGEHFC